METHIVIKGMHCASCKALIEEVALEKTGVTACTVDLEKGVGSITHGTDFDLDAFAAEIASMGPYVISKV